MYTVNTHSSLKESALDDQDPLLIFIYIGTFNWCSKITLDLEYNR